MHQAVPQKVFLWLCYVLCVAFGEGSNHMTPMDLFPNLGRVSSTTWNIGCLRTTIQWSCLDLQSWRRSIKRSQKNCSVFSNWNVWLFVHAGTFLRLLELAKGHTDRDVGARDASASKRGGVGGEVLGGATDYRNGCRLGWLVVLRSRWWGPGPPALWEMFEDRGEEVSGCHLSCNVQADISLKIIPHNVQFAARNGGFHSINWIPEECNWQNWAEIPLIKLRILQTLLLSIYLCWMIGSDSCQKTNT